MSEQKSPSVNSIPVWGVFLLFLGIIFLLPLGNPLAFLARIANRHRTRHPAPALQSLAGERADSGAVLRLSWHRHLAIRTDAAAGTNHLELFGIAG